MKQNKRQGDNESGEEKDKNEGKKNITKRRVEADKYFGKESERRMRRVAT